jgi:formyl-CoA transferase
MEKTTFYRDACSDTSGPLEGIKVIEATTMWAGPMAGCLFADLGATVVKVEHPEGEVSRKLSPLLPDSLLTVPHETVNRNKKNVSLNLKLSKGRELFLKLCQGCDIVIENFKPGTLDAWGVGYDDVRKVKSDVVYLSISMYGQFGPYSDRPGYDPLAQNFTGWSSMNGEPFGDPIKAPTFLADDLGGLHGVVGALAALNHRNRTGEGQHVDVALVDSLLFQSNGHLTSGKLGVALPRMGNRSSVAAPVNNYKCLDGSVYGAVLLDRHWKALCSLLLREDLSHLDGAARKKELEMVDKVVADWCVSKTTEEVVSQLTDIGLAIARVNTFGEAAEHSQIKSRDMLQDIELADGKKVPLTGPAVKFSRTPTKIRHGAPKLGADNYEVFKSFGLSFEQIEKLKEEGVI